MKKLFVGLTVFFLGIRLFAGVMEVPRKVFVINTQYFDILFSKESLDTAVLLAEKGDVFFLEAKQAFDLQYDFKTLVVISPDSQVLSVNYSPAPYNRIVVYEGSKVLSQEAFKNGLLDLFKYEVVRAVSQSVRNEFWYKTSNFIGGDSLQPVALVNMPFSFLEGAVNTELAKDESGLLYDKWNLQLLSQMKIEGNIPTLLQFSGAMDIYPGEDFTRVVGSAFCAYIQQRFGLDKFTELWTASGKIQLFRFNKKIFQQVYGVELEQVWQEFNEAIPVPEVKEDKSTLFFEYDNDSVYKFLAHTPYGFIWYDQLKQEVDIFDDYNFFKMKQLLFLASNVYQLYTSEDGRYLIVSFIRGRDKENLKKFVTQIFDLKDRRFLSDSEEEVWREENFKGFTEIFDKQDEIGIYSPVILDKNNKAALICKNNQWFVESFDSDAKEGLYYQIKFGGEILRIRDLRRIDISKFPLAAGGEYSKTALSFDFVLENKGAYTESFTRPGIILLDKDFKPVQVYLSNEDYSGGIHNSILLGDKLYYFSRKFNYDEFRFVDIKNLSFEEGQILYPDIIFPGYRDIPSEAKIETKDGVNFLSGYELNSYNPWGLMFHGKWTPMMPVYDITLENEIELIPGLGLTFETQSDPFSNNRIVLSGGAMYFPLDFTKLFNASEETKEELQAQREDFSKDIAFSAYGENSSTPADLSLGGIFRFNLDGEYALKAIGGVKYSVPLRMDFRRMTLNAKALYTASTSYWDSHQIERYPNLSQWPELKESYRSWSGVMALEYTNIHQYGISPLKKMGIDTGMLLTSTWDRNLQELLRKQKDSKLPNDGSNGSEDIIQNYRWKSIYAPTQINLGAFLNIEVPFLLPFENHEGWILSLPATMNAELFYTNGTALKWRTEILIAGRELQNGFEKINLYFPRFGFYTGYELSMDYDTATVVLPDLRDITRFYDVSTSCYLNDSLFARFSLYTTPVIGKFSVDQIISNFNIQYFLQKKEWKLNCNFELKLK